MQVLDHLSTLSRSCLSTQDEHCKVFAECVLYSSTLGVHRQTHREAIVCFAGKNTRRTKRLRVSDQEGLKGPIVLRNLFRLLERFAPHRLDGGYFLSSFGCCYAVTFLFHAYVCRHFGLTLMCGREKLRCLLLHGCAVLWECFE